MPINVGDMIVKRAFKRITKRGETMAGTPKPQLADLFFTQKKKCSFLILDDSIIKASILARSLKKLFGTVIEKMVLISNNTPPVSERICPYFPESMKNEIVNSPLEWLSIAQDEYDRLTKNPDSLTAVFVDFDLGRKCNTLPFIRHVKDSKKETILLIGISAQGAEAIEHDEQFKEFSSSVVKNFTLLDSKCISEIASVIATKCNKFLSEPVDSSERRLSSAETGPLVAAGFFPEEGGRPSIPTSENLFDAANIGLTGISAH